MASPFPTQQCQGCHYGAFSPHLHLCTDSPVSNLEICDLSETHQTYTANPLTAPSPRDPHTLLYDSFLKLGSFSYLAFAEPVLHPAQNPTPYSMEMPSNPSNTSYWAHPPHCPVLTHSAGVQSCGGLGGRFPPGRGGVRAPGGGHRAS